MFKQIVLASNNAGKLRELSQLFAQQQIEVLPQSAFQITECAEPHFTFIENALAKARHASKHSGLPALADDSGICFSALNGAPGVWSARFAGDTPKSDAANNAKANAELAQHSNKSCYYVCVLVLVRHEHDPQPIIAQGIGADNGKPMPQAATALATTPIFIFLNTVARLPNCRPKPKTASAIAVWPYKP